MQIFKRVRIRHRWTAKFDFFFKKKFHESTEIIALLKKKRRQRSRTQINLKKKNRNVERGERSVCGGGEVKSTALVT